MPITDSVLEQVEKIAVKDGATKGLHFKNRKGIEYKFDIDKEYEMLVQAYMVFCDLENVTKF
jgi:hypothetical protein